MFNHECNYKCMNLIDTVQCNSLEQVPVPPLAYSGRRAMQLLVIVLGHHFITYVLCKLYKSTPLG